MNRFLTVPTLLFPLSVMAFVLTATPAAAITFDFENGDPAPWAITTTGGSGSTGVELHNGSQMAYVKHVGNGSHALSFDFPYQAAAPLSFDMQAVAVLSPFGNHASAGVTLSFYSAFNVPLGTAGFYNTTNPASLGANTFAIDAVQHTYAGTQAAFAALAGLDATAGIAKFSLRFDAIASNSNLIGSSSSASVWFDNVSTVPEPQTLASMSLGLTLMALFIARRNPHSAGR